MPSQAADPEIIRAQRQKAVDARVAELRSEAAAKQAKADQLHGAVSQDHAFWTQPAYGNAAGRAFARRRDNERAKLIKASTLAGEAKDLRDRADSMERAGARVAGDAAAAREASIIACNVSVGDLVDTTHYGVRRVLKVNTKTVLVEGGLGPLKVEKQYVRKAA